MIGIPSNILVIDSSTSVMRIGVSCPDGRIVQMENAERFSHAEHIVPLIESAISDAKLKREELAGMVVSCGPGSFTGLRVGMATAKGMAIALGIPLAAPSIFEAAQVRLPELHDKAAMLVQSRKDEYYLGLIGNQGFDRKSIRVVRGEGIIEAVGKRSVYCVDFDSGRLPFLNDRIIGKEEYSIELKDFLIAAQEKLAAGGEELAALEPLYIQNFPARKK